MKKKDLSRCTLAWAVSAALAGSIASPHLLAAQLVVSDGSTQVATGSYDLLQATQNSTILGQGALVVATGTKAAVQAYNGGTVTLDAASRVETFGVSSHAMASNYFGVSSQGRIEANGATLITHGDRAMGMAAGQSGARAVGATVETSGAQSVGLAVDVGSLTVSGARVATAGALAHGLQVTGVSGALFTTNRR